MPRLLHRLFRLLRTFTRIASETGDVTVIDSRIAEKRYGKTVKQYMTLCCEELSSDSTIDTARGSSPDFPENWQMNLF